MKMRHQPDPKLSIPMLIVSCIGALTYAWFVYGDATHMIITAAVLIVVTFFVLYTMKLEKKADNKAAHERPELEGGSRFRSVNWRKGYLDYAQEKGWDRILGRTMKSDMCRRYNNGTDRAVILMGLFFIGCGTALLFSPQPAGTALGGIGLGGFSLFMGIKDICGYPVRKWLKNTFFDRQELERSYMKGRLLVHGCSGVNIGSELIIFFTKKTAGALKLSEINSVSRNIVRLKKYQDSTYAGEEYQHFLVLTRNGRDIKIQLSEYQVEMALEELERAGFLRGQSSPVSEKTDNQIVT